MRRVSLVSYNIHKGVGPDRKLRLDRIASVVRHYDPDFVCLQEVLWDPDGDGEPQPRTLAHGIGLRHAIVALNCERPQGIYGNMTLSRYPILEHQNIELTIRFKRERAVLYTRHRLPSSDVHVFNAHLGLANYERLIQAKEVAEEVGRIVPADEPVVLAGDLNDWRHRLFPRILAPAGFRCAIGDADDPGHATYPSWFPVGALDKIFVKGRVHHVRALPSRLRLARAASDHLPLVAEFEVSPR
jgi:endonuclease/exonuclease/phosphatase family metal-dependent hydrolase